MHRYAIIDKICQNAVVLHVELGNIICLLPLIERASLGWDRWDLMGFGRHMHNIKRKRTTPHCATLSVKSFCCLPFQKGLLGCWVVVGRRTQAALGTVEAFAAYVAQRRSRTELTPERAKRGAVAKPCANPCNARKEWDRSKLVVSRYVSACYSGIYPLVN